MKRNSSRQFCKHILSIIHDLSLNRTIKCFSLLQWLHALINSVVSLNITENCFSDKYKYAYILLTDGYNNKYVCCASSVHIRLCVCNLPKVIYLFGNSSLFSRAFSKKFIQRLIGYAVYCL